MTNATIGRRAARAVALLAMLTLGLTSTATAATAAPAAPAEKETLPFDGQLTGTGGLGGPLPCGADLSLFHDGTIVLTDGTSAAFHLEYCVTVFDPDVVDTPVYGGSFTITTASGTLSGTVSGTSQSANLTPDGFPTHVALTVTAGTDAYAGATGVLQFDGFLGFAATSIDGTISGDLTITTDDPANVPTRMKDCRRRTWTHFTDDSGTPFESRRACRAFVRVHRHG